MHPQHAQVRVPLELTFELTHKTQNPYWDGEPRLSLHSPDGRVSEVPMFWQGNMRFAARVCPEQSGLYHYQVMSSTGISDSAVRIDGEFHAEPYQGSNPLFQHGGLRPSQDGRYLCHTDGTPFFWLADTWWYGATGRCQWPQAFELLVQDRVAKGFSVVQLVVGIPPEVDADHPSVVNEGGHPFLRQWDMINPAYFEWVDKRIEDLVNHGIVPCILGGWGYQIDWMGVEAMTCYWRYLVARYAAYPVVWCLAGESDLLDLPVREQGATPQALLYTLYREASRLPGPARSFLRQVRDMMRQPSMHVGERRAERRKRWCEVGQAVAHADPYHRVITTHPSAASSAHESLNDAPWIGMTGIQSGHAESSRTQMYARIVSIRQQRPHLPVVNLEPWYEGILDSFWAADQRYAFWACMLAGAAGHSYGANGLWQMARDDGFLGHWGNANWAKAHQLTGSRHLGVGKGLLSAIPWQLLQADPECIRRSAAGSARAPLVGAVAEELYLLYFPSDCRAEEYEWHGSQNRASAELFWWNVRSGERHHCRETEQRSSGDGSVRLPQKPTEEDWVLVLDFGGYCSR